MKLCHIVFSTVKLSNGMKDFIVDILPKNWLKSFGTIILQNNYERLFRKYWNTQRKIHYKTVFYLTKIFTLQTQYWSICVALCCSHIKFHNFLVFMLNGEKWPNIPFLIARFLTYVLKFFNIIMKGLKPCRRV